MSIDQVITSLYRAAIDGDLVSLQNLLSTHPNLLDQFTDAGPYKETPLHVAVQLGHTQLAKEMILRKPELSSKLDSLRSSPLHLAAAANYKDNSIGIEMVKLLLNANPEMCSVHDKFGNNPMHVAAVNGGSGVDVVVIKAMIQAWPVAAKEKAKHGNTILHLCVKHGQLEALKVLLQLFGDDHEFVNSKNDDGDTILHLAAANKQTQIFEYLIGSNSLAIEVSTQNLKGWTAFNILAWSSEQLDMELDDNPTAGSGKHDVNDDASSNKLLEAATADTNSSNAGLRKDMKIIMLVSTLIAGMAFQAMINPPGGVFQVSPIDTVVAAAAAAAPAPAPAKPKPGSPVMAFYDKGLYDQYSNATTISFATAFTNIFLITALGDDSFAQRSVFLGLVYLLGGASMTSLSSAYSYVLFYNTDGFRQLLYNYATFILWYTPILLWALWHFKNYVLKKAASSCCLRRRRRQTPTTRAHNNNRNRVTI